MKLSQFIIPELKSRQLTREQKLRNEAISRLILTLLALISVWVYWGQLKAILMLGLSFFALYPTHVASVAVILTCLVVISRR